MGDVKVEPMEHERETPPPKFTNPKDALNFYTRKSPAPFPSAVSRSRNNYGNHVVSLEFNGTPYEAEHANLSCAEQILAVYILYGEFAQDSVDLYNYFLRLTKSDAAVLDSDRVNAHVDQMKSRALDSSPKVARVAPYSSHDNASSANGVGASHHGSNSISSISSMQEDGEAGSSESRREWQQQRPVSSGVPFKIPKMEKNNASGNKRPSSEMTEDGEGSRSEHLQNEDDDGEGDKEDKESTSEATKLKMMVVMEAYSCKQLLVFTSKGIENNSEISIDDHVAKFEKFISSVDHDFDIQHWAFTDVPKGFSPFYTLLKVRNKLTFLDTGDEPIFVGKGLKKSQAWANAIDVATDFVKRSIALNFMLMGPSDSAVDKLARVMKTVPMQVPFKHNFNKIFDIHQTSIVYEGKSYKSAYFHTKEEAKIDVAQKVLRDKQFVFYGDAINRKLNVK